MPPFLFAVLPHVHGARFFLGGEGFRWLVVFHVYFFSSFCFVVRSLKTLFGGVLFESRDACRHHQHLRLLISSFFQYCLFLRSLNYSTRLFFFFFFLLNIIQVFVYALSYSRSINVAAPCNTARPRRPFSVVDMLAFFLVIFFFRVKGCMSPSSASAPSFLLLISAVLFFCSLHVLTFWTRVCFF